MKSEGEIRAAIAHLDSAFTGAKHAGDTKVQLVLFGQIGVLSWCLGEDKFQFGLVIKDCEEVDKQERKARDN